MTTLQKHSWTVTHACGGPNIKHFWDFKCPVIDKLSPQFVRVLLQGTRVRVTRKKSSVCVKEWTTGLQAEWCYQPAKDLPVSYKAAVFFRPERQLLCAMLPPTATKPPEAHDPITQTGFGWGFLGGFLVLFLGNTLNCLFEFICIRKLCPPSLAFFNN